jgi:hypothetical protein
VVTNHYGFQTKCFILSGLENPAYRYCRLRIVGGNPPPHVIPKRRYWESMFLSLDPRQLSSGMTTGRDILVPKFERVEDLLNGGLLNISA